MEVLKADIKTIPMRYNQITRELSETAISDPHVTDLSILDEYKREVKSLFAVQTADQFLDYVEGRIDPSSQIKSENLLSFLELKPLDELYIFQLVQMFVESNKEAEKDRLINLL